MRTESILGAWQDRYQTPTVEGLLGELGPEARLFAERAILALGRKPKPAWIVPWHWALSFDHPRGPVYLIPEPGRVRLVARLTRPAFEQMLAPKSARQARDAVLNASCVGESVWTD
jgi:hypothetical protein